MRITFKGEEETLTGENIVYPVFEGEDIKDLGDTHISLDFTGKEDEISFQYVKDCTSNPFDKSIRIFLVGLGKKEEITTEKFRKAYSGVAKKLLSMDLDTATIVLPKDVDVIDAETGISEGLFLTDYAFDKYKSKKEKHFKEITFIGATNIKRIQEKFIISESVKYVRDLQNDTGDFITPDYLAKEAKKLARLIGVKCTVLNKRKIKKLGMGLLLAVNRGSDLDPKFIIVEYNGNKSSTDKTAIIGKGLTFDSGGYNLKLGKNMLTMRSDMTGGAVVLGVLKAVARMGLKKNIVGVIPATENMIGSKAFRPGDVFTSMSGKTVEISNTDAEGRLILADAITYTVQKIKPTRIIDIATLTGAVVAALGDSAIGAMTNDDYIYYNMASAGKATYERVWQLPIFEEHRDQLKSSIADINNCGTPGAGSITAAAFLESFVGKTPWLHLDIAGVDWAESAKDYIPKNGTGIGVRLLVEYLRWV